MAVLDPATQAPAVGDTGVYNGVNLIGVATGLVAYPATWKPVVSANDASHEVVNGTATQLLALNAAYTETSTPTEAQLIELATSLGAVAGNGFVYDAEDGATIYREVKTLGAGITLAAPKAEYWDYSLDDLSTLDLTNFTSGARVRLLRSDGVQWVFEVDAATNGGKSWIVLDDGSGGTAVSSYDPRPIFIMKTAVTRDALATYEGMRSYLEDGTKWKYSGTWQSTTDNFGPFTTSFYVGDLTVAEATAFRTAQGIEGAAYQETTTP